MKLGLSKTVKMISILPITVLIGISGYEGYKQYKEYETIIPIQSLIENNSALINLYTAISIERGLSAGYFGSAGTINFEELDKFYPKVDEEIETVKKVLSNKNYLSLQQDQKNELNDLLGKIKEIRTKTTDLDTEFNPMFFDYYTKITTKIYDLIQSEKITSSNANIAINNINFLNILKSIDSVSLEKGFISKVLEEYIPVSPSDIKKMEVLFASSKYIEPKGISKESLQEKIKTISKEIHTLDIKLNEFKGSIGFSAETGEFIVSNTDWSEKEQEKINALVKIKDLLISDINSEIDDTIQTQKIQLSVLLATLILALLFLYLSQKVTASMKRNIENLSKIFKKMSEISGSEAEINLDTDDGQKDAYEVIEDSVVVLTESKDKAIKASESKSMFLANMSHEIRTPLNGIVGFTELLTHTELDDEQLEFVETIEKSSENLLSIINDILDLSKIESNKIEIEEILFNPLDHFEQAAELYGAKAAEKNIDLSFFIDPVLSNKLLKGDPTRLKEVIINLMSNAVKFTPKNGSIKVNIKTIGETADNRLKVYFEVQDSGIGIEEDKLGLIFTAFSQADSSTTRKFGGTGLGLTISSKFIELMGGDLEVSSEIGKGTKFFFTVAFETMKSKETNTEGLFEGSNLVFVHSKKEKEQNEILTTYMEYMGVNVEVANNKTQIENFKADNKADALLVDYEFLLEQKPEDMQKYTEITDIPFFLIIKPTLSKKEKTFSAMENVKYVFEPVSLTKLFKTFNSVGDKLNRKVIEVQEEVQETKKVRTTTATPTAFRGHVLVAEDNIINQKLILKTLEKFKLTADLADNGEKAFEARKAGDYDIIFMDINMPVMTGVEATHSILEWEESEGKAHIPIIAVTANAIKGDREKFIDEGMDEYITKPLKRQDIEVIMKKFFGDEEFDNFLAQGE